MCPRFAIRKGVKVLSRLDIMTPSRAQTVIDGLYRDVERRIAASPPGLCPVDLAMNFLNLCHAQTCGKCMPCRVGLGQLSDLMESVLDGKATMETIALIERTARVIVNSADCAIGRDAARLVLDGIQGFRDDYEEHVLRHRCLGGMQNPVPCVALCPAGVDIPGYTVLVKYGRYADAVRLIRQDNPFPSACAYICEHPCEARCRRNMIDDAVNIRGLKRYAVDHAGYVPHPACAEETGKTVAIVGGGPSGLSAAYYLALMGHKVTVYEKRAKLGGMLRYGIPAYRLPREILDAEIASLLSVGIDAKVNVDIGDEITFDELRSRYDALYLALGAHTDKKTGIEGEDAEGVMSAVEMLREIGDDHMPDFRGKEIVVIGGGNVAMDVCRSAVRLGARKVSCVYRRRREDMTALPEEVEGAVAEGVEMVTLQAPVRIETNGQGHAVALWTQPQIIGEMDDKGRPKPEKAKLFEKRIAADGIVVAIGQGVETHGFEQSKITIKRGAFVGRGQRPDRQHGRRICRRRLRHGSGHRHPRHRGGQGRGGEHRRIPRLSSCHRRGCGGPNCTAEQQAAPWPHQHHRARGRRAQARLQVHRVRPDGRGGLRRGVPLPALRPLRLRHFPRREEGQMVKNVTLTIDHKSITVPETTTILEAARMLNINIPTLCYLKDVNEIAACRLCCVEVKGMERLVPACDNVVADGMEVFTNSPMAREARRANLRLILSEHDTSCTSCSRSGNCTLQSLANDFNMRGEHYPTKLRREAVDYSTPLIRENDKCVKCMRCIQICENVQTVKIWDLLGTGSRATVDASRNRRIQDTECTYCGQCITHCPTAALRERDDTGIVFDAIDDPNTVTVVQVAPAVRAAWAEQFNLSPEFATPKRMAAALRELGFNYVFDTDFAADLTIMEEGSEFLERFTHKKDYRWPMFTSCCPGWVRFLKSQYPERTEELSTAKSPQQMFGAIAKSYFAEKIGIDPKRLFVVSIMPCVAKKSECTLPTMRGEDGIPDVDVSITTRELDIMLRANHISPVHLPEEEFDSPLGSGTGAAVVFGATGGVMDAALRSAYYLVTGENPDPDAFTAVRGMDGWKEASFNIPTAGEVKVAVVSGLGNARKLLYALERGEVSYDFVEVMACPGGCAGGGGQPIHDGQELAETRGGVLWRLDKDEALRFSHENPDVQALYRDYLGKPLGEKSHHLLHTDHLAWEMPQAQRGQ